jgi:hypothetical protein
LPNGETDGVVVDGESSEELQAAPHAARTAKV